MNGDCYMVAAKLVTDGGAPDGAVLCHGTCTGQGPIEGVAFGHAWVEYEGRVGPWPVTMVIDKSNGCNWHAPAPGYYSLGECRDVVRYTADEARAMMREHEHFGPWHEERGGVA